MEPGDTPPDFGVHTGPPAIPVVTDEAKGDEAVPAEETPVQQGGSVALPPPKETPPETVDGPPADGVPAEPPAAPLAEHEISDEIAVTPATMEEDRVEPATAPEEGDSLYDEGLRAEPAVTEDVRVEPALPPTEADNQADLQAPAEPAIAALAALESSGESIAPEPIAKDEPQPATATPEAADGPPDPELPIEPVTALLAPTETADEIGAIPAVTEGAPVEPAPALVEGDSPHDEGFRAEPAVVDVHAEATPPLTEADKQADLGAPAEPAMVPLIALESSSEEVAPEPIKEDEPPVSTLLAAPQPEAADGSPAPEVPAKTAPAPIAALEIPDEIAAIPAVAEVASVEPAPPSPAEPENPADLEAPSEPEPLIPRETSDETVAPEVRAPEEQPEPPPAAADTAPSLDLPVAPPIVPLIAREIPRVVTAPPAVAFDRPAEPIAPPPLRPASITTSVQSPWPARLRRAVLVLVTLATGYAALVLFLIVVYRFVDPPRSTVMIGLHLSGQSVDYRPVSIGNVSSYLQRAVVTSEDARFCSHGGVDWGALAEAIQDARGGSTITMQTAKNLFLWPSRSYIRKAIEIPVALTIDFVWPKRRILEVYLNIAEWGPGIFGAEAAAWYHFNKPASRLTQQEATLLAASLPNPIAREAGDPGRITALLAARLRGRMMNSDAYVGCLGLRSMPKAAPDPVPRPAATKVPPKAAPWQTKTVPAKPDAPFNPWQN